MKISELIMCLGELQAKVGDVETIVLSEHNTPQKTYRVQTTKVIDITQHYPDEVGEEELEDFPDAATVVIIWG